MDSKSWLKMKIDYLENLKLFGDLTPKEAEDLHHYKDEYEEILLADARKAFKIKKGIK